MRIRLLLSLPHIEIHTSVTTTFIHTKKNHLKYSDMSFRS